MADVPFLGCKISLISKCDIRYEGILYCVDAKESTIALSKVKSYGTETRGDPSCYVAPKNDIYDIIIFRASDVKDLRVDAPEPPGLSDPAIISAHQSSSSAKLPTSLINNNKDQQQQPQQSQHQEHHEKLHQSTRGGRGTVGGEDNNERPQRGSGEHQDLRSDAPRMPRGANDMRDRDDRRDNVRMPRGADDRRGLDRRGDGPRMSRGGGGGDRRVDDRRHDDRRGDDHHHRRNDDRRHDDRRGDDRRGDGGGRMQRGGGNRHMNDRYNNNSRDYNPRRGPNNHTHNNNSNINNRDENSKGNGHMQRRGPMQGNRRPRSGDRTGAPRGPRKAPLKFQGEYDFDEANKIFAELEGKMKGMKIKDENNGEASGDGKNPAERPGSGSGYDSEDHYNKDNDSKDEYGESVDGEYYDKTKSFFDNISCEASERSQGKVNKPDWRKERQTNAETFGVSANYRRGGYRGYHRR